MASAPPRQLDFRYQGRAASVIAAPKLESKGWSWAVLLDERQPMEHEGPAFSTPELAIASGKATVEDYLDSADDA